MDPVALWSYLHILLFVFWLGTDVGVFTAAIFLKNPTYSFETRLVLIKLLSIVDIFPRLCFALIFPVGLHLTRALEIYQISDAFLATAWIVGVSWCVAIFVMMRNESKPIGKLLAKLQVWFEGVLGLFFVAVGGVSLATGAPLAANWYAGKILLFGFVFWAAIALHILFKPFEQPFMAIGEHGSTPEREAAVTAAINRALKGVMCLYILIAVIAFLGTVKPF